MTLNELIRSKMKAFRESKGMLQREFSDRTGIPLYQISRMERGVADWTLARIEQVCSAFKLPHHYFLGADNDTQNPRYELVQIADSLDEEKYQLLLKLLHLANQIDHSRIQSFVLAFQSLLSPPR